MVRKIVTMKFLWQYVVQMVNVSPVRMELVHRVEMGKKEAGMLVTRTLNYLQTW